MRTTITVDERIANEARELTGIDKFSVLVTTGLELLIERHGAQRLAALGGCDPSALAAPRNR